MRCTLISRAITGRIAGLPLLLLSLSVAAIPAAAADKPALVRAAPVATASLVADARAIAAGIPFTVAVRLRMPAGWHTYWTNPGESGAPGNVAWRLPDGFAATAVAWPTPERFNSGPIVGYGYTGDVWLTARITPPATLAAGSTARITASADWLVCAKICVPEQATLTLTLPVEAMPRPATADVARDFAAATARQPRPAPAPVTATGHDSILVLGVDGLGDDGAAITGATFFPAAFGLIDDAAPQQFERTGSGIRLTLVRPATGAPPPTELQGVLVVDHATGRTGYTVRAPIRS